MKKILHKSFPLQIKADGGDRTIEGFGSTFGNVDQQEDIVLPGAFTKSLQTRMPKMLWQHNQTQPVGVWDSATETPEGLYLKGRILETTLGNDVYTLAKAGAIDSMSIGFSTKESVFDKKTGVRSLKTLDLHEVSLVTFPANEMARITTVKSEDGALMTEREFEKFLRDVGNLSLKEAQTVVSKGYRSLLPCRDGDAQKLTSIIDIFNQIKL